MQHERVISNKEMRRLGIERNRGSHIVDGNLLLHKTKCTKWGNANMDYQWQDVDHTPDA